MSANTSIEWTDRTWNPVRGCSVISPGCHSCYAMKTAHRFSGPGKPYEGLTKQTARGPQWTGKVVTVESALLEPLSWRKPQRIFVNSMSDLFHEDVPEQFITDVFGVMALAHWHTFQILTKRPERMRAYLAAGDHGVINQFSSIQQCGGIAPRQVFAALDLKRRDRVGWQFPLPNVWLGVSLENQHFADERIPLLLETPAAVRFVSAEPLLGPVDFTFHGSRIKGWDEDWRYNVLSGEEWAGPRDESPERSQHLDWVICGGESGPGARPFDLAWARSIVQQCKAAGVPVFVKQLGAFPTDIARPINVTEDEAERWMRDGWTRVITSDGVFFTKHPRLKDRKGGDIDEWPADLRVREFPQVAA